MAACCWVSRSQEERAHAPECRRIHQPDGKAEQSIPSPGFAVTKQIFFFFFYQSAPCGSVPLHTRLEPAGLFSAIRIWQLFTLQPERCCVCLLAASDSKLDAHFGRKNKLKEYRTCCRVVENCIQQHFAVVTIEYRPQFFCLKTTLSSLFINFALIKM